MKLNVLMVREIFKMLNQYAVDYPTFPVNQHHSHLFVIAGGMLRRLGRKLLPHGDMQSSHNCDA